MNGILSAPSSGPAEQSTGPASRVDASFGGPGERGLRPPVSDARTHRAKHRTGLPRGRELWGSWGARAAAPVSDARQAPRWGGAHL